MRSFFEKYGQNLTGFLRKHQNIFLWGVGILTLMILIWVLIWNILAFMVEDNLTKWFKQEKNHNFLTAYHVGAVGFPFSFDVLIDKLRYRHPSGHFGWQTAQIRVSPDSLQSRSIEAIFPKTHYFIYKDDKTQINQMILLKSKNLILQTSLKEAIPNPIILAADQTIIQDKNKAMPWQIDAWKIMIYDDYTQEAGKIDPMIAINFSAKTIMPHRFILNILETPFEDLRGKIYIHYPSRLKEIPNWNHFLTRGYDTPEFFIPSFSMYHALSNFRLEGVLRPDKKMNFNGELTVYIGDYAKLLGFLEKKGVIAPTFAKQLRLMLSLETIAHFFGQNNDLKLDLTVKNNIIYRKGIPILNLNKK